MDDLAVQQIKEIKFYRMAGTGGTFVLSAMGGGETVALFLLQDQAEIVRDQILAVLPVQEAEPEPTSHGCPHA